MKNYAFILAGGKGERLWPLSRIGRPKQLVNLFSDSTLLEQAIKRLEGFIPQDNIFIICDFSLSKAIEKKIPFFNPNNFIIEPRGRNSAPAIFLAAAYLKKTDPDSTMMILTSDHFIRPHEIFQNNLKEAARIASQNQALVTMGIVPSYPETGFGYIITQENSLKVKKFTEKPDIKTAQKFLISKKAYWNSGMFIWNTTTFLKNVYEIQPQEFKIIEQIAQLDEKTIRTNISDKMFSQFTATSIDYSIMEHADNVYCVAAEFEWNDVGSWDAIEQLITEDNEGNTIIGESALINSKNNVIYSKDHLITTIGIENTIIVSDDNKTLVCKKNQSQLVKEILKNLKANDRLKKYL